MAITYEAVPALEYVSHVDVEQLGNQNLYAVISGCTVTESVSDMVVTVAAGVALVNGVKVTVAGGTATLVSDPSNMRWNYVGIDDTGAVVRVLGDAASSSAVQPTKPPLGGNTILKMYKVEAGQTIAGLIAVAPEKRIIGAPVGWKLVGKNTTEQTTTSTSAVDLVEITLDSPITVDQPVWIIVNFRKLATAANLVRIGLTINATEIAAPGSSNTAIGFSSATQQAEDGVSMVYIAPRSANYLNGVTGWTTSKVSSSGAAAGAWTATPVGLTAPVPNATITEITIRGINNATSNSLSVKDVYIYAGASS